MHTFSARCPEVDRMLLFRDWLRTSAADRELYARTKQELAAREWIQQYADAKAAVVKEIMGPRGSGGALSRLPSPADRRSAWRRMIRINRRYR
jgi:GrpB protein